MASLETLWGPAARRFIRAAVTKTSTALQTKLITVTGPLQNELHHLAVKNVHRAVRRFITTESTASSKTCRLDRSKLPASKTSRRVSQFSGQAPFATTLRPNLTGGAMPRTAGGYSLGGGARYFSHTPAAPAQVVQNVSQAMRAFFLSGQKLRYDGMGPRGERQYRAVSAAEDEAMRKFGSFDRSAPGSFVDFQLSPTITALGPIAAAVSLASGTSGFKANAAFAAAAASATSAGASLNKEGFLDVLSADFGRALQDLTAIFADLGRLAALGDLPIVLENHNTLRVRFPGVDSETARRLCEDVGITRGAIGQDANFDSVIGAPVALKFPFAPDVPKSLAHPGNSVRSLEGYELPDSTSSVEEDYFFREAVVQEIAENPWLSDPEEIVTVSSALSVGEEYSDFEGLEGIYRFIDECDRAHSRVR